MKKKLFIVITCLMPFVKLLGQNSGDSFIKVVNNLKPIVISNDYLRYAGQPYSAKIYLENTDSLYNYEVVYQSEKAKFNQGLYYIQFLALPDRPIFLKNEYEKPWIYYVRIYNNTHDTILKFSSNYLVHSPILRHNEKDTLIAYKNSLNILKLDFPLYKDFFTSRKVYIFCDNAQIIEANDTICAFVPTSDLSYITIKVGCGGNPIGSFVYKVIDIPNPIILISDNFSVTDKKLKIDLVYSEEYKLTCKGDSKVTPTDGTISILRENMIISKYHINSTNFNSLKIGDTLLINITEAERTTYNGKKLRINLNEYKAIKIN